MLMQGLIGFGGKRSVAAAASFVDYAGANSSTSISISKPTGTVDGDLMVAYVLGATRADITASPSGWSELTAYSGNSPSIWTKVASSEGSSYSWDVSGNNAGVIMTFRNAAVDTYGTWATDETGTSITASESGLLLCAGSNTSPSVTTPPSGLTLIASAGVANPSVKVYMLDPSAAGSTGTHTIGWTTAGNRNTILVQII